MRVLPRRARTRLRPALENDRVIPTAHDHTPAAVGAPGSLPPDESRARQRFGAVRLHRLVRVTGVVAAGPLVDGVLAEVLGAQERLDAEGIAVRHRPHDVSRGQDLGVAFEPGLLFGFVVCANEPGGADDFGGGVAVGIAEGVDVILVGLEPCHVPQHNILVGIAEAEDRMVASLVEEAEPEEKLHVAVGRLELENSGPLTWCAGWGEG